MINYALYSSLMAINRLKDPTKHILVLEDVLTNQANIARHFADIFEHEGEVEVSYISGGKYAEVFVNVFPPDLIILDHDIPSGSGWEFLEFIRKKGLDIPVITFSGIPFNNFHLMDLGANYCFEKQAVISGKADELIFEILGLNNGNN